MRARPAEVRPGFRARHNYVSRPGRKAAGVFLRSENTEAGSRKTAMRFMRGYASRRAPAVRAESCDCNFQAKKLTGKILAFRNARNWAQFHNPKDVAISLSLEASELLEHFQWKNPKEIKKHIKTNKSAITDELGDVLYWVLLLGHDLKIDVLPALDAKLKKNALKYPVKKAKGRHTKYSAAGY